MNINGISFDQVPTLPSNKILMRKTPGVVQL